MKSPDKKRFLSSKDVKTRLVLAGGAASLVILSFLAGRVCGSEKESARQDEVYLPFINPEESTTPVPSPTDKTIPSPETVEVYPTSTGTASATETPNPILTATETATSTTTPTKTLQVTVTATPISTETDVPSPEVTDWVIKSVSSMNQSKDRLCDPRSPEWIAEWVSRMAELGITHVGLETPYDNPVCNGSEGNYALDYTQEWLSGIRNQRALDGQPLRVWHRHSFNQYEGNYDNTKNPNLDYAAMISDYILAHPTFFKAGDVFTIVPEPQNGGIVGATGCAQDICIFSSVDDFKSFLINATHQAQEAFKQIGLENQVTFACCGFDGYLLWGDNNPDHLGTSILDKETMRQLGIMTIDHYPAEGANMVEDLQEMRQLWPANEFPVIIGETGVIRSSEENAPADVIELMKAFKQDPNVVGVQYWQGGPAGPEGLIHNSFEPYPHFFAVQAAFVDSN